MSASTSAPSCRPAKRSGCSAVAIRGEFILQGHFGPGGPAHMLGQLWCVDPPDGLGAGEGDAAAKTGDARRSATIDTAATTSVDATTTMPHGRGRSGAGTGVSGAGGCTVGTLSSGMFRMVSPHAQRRL